MLKISRKFRRMFLFLKFYNYSIAKISSLTVPLYIYIYTWANNAPYKYNRYGDGRLISNKIAMVL